jgi:nitroreductase
MLEKPAKTQVPIHDLITKRWSPCAFDPNRRLSHEQIMALLEAARWAPSCRGEQPWRYLVFDKQTNPTAWEQAWSCLEEANQKWAKNAPLLILATVVSTFEHNGQPNRWAQYDCGAASENICLQAVSLGLVAHQMGGFKLAKVHELLGLPAEATAMAMIAVGYQASPDLLDGNLKQRELLERSRKPLAENFFEGPWGVSIKNG